MMFQNLAVLVQPGCLNKRPWVQAELELVGRVQLRPFPLGGSTPDGLVGWNRPPATVRDLPSIDRDKMELAVHGEDIHPNHGCHVHMTLGCTALYGHPTFDPVRELER